MNYLGFELRIGAGSGTTYPVTVIHAAAGGEPSIQTTIPVDDANLHGWLNQLMSLRGDPAMARAIGQLLFDSLIKDEIRDAYTSSVSRANQEDCGLRLRLIIDPPAVAALPWEFLYDTIEDKHVCLLKKRPLSRYMALPRDRKTEPANLPLRILVMVATPSDLPKLDVNRETAQLKRALEHQLAHDDVELDWVLSGRWDDLLKKLDDGPWHVFHFIGHGGYDPIDGEGMLAFCNEQGTAHLMSSTDLGYLFSGHPSLRLAFLNACEGGRSSHDESFSSVGAALISHGIPAVISMQLKITDQASLDFSRHFYDLVAVGEPIDIAMTRARLAVKKTDYQSIEWATPVLHMHSRDGQLFKQDIPGRIFDESKPTFRRAQTAEMEAPQAQQRQPKADIHGEQLSRALSILHGKVQEYWIDGVLKQSLVYQMLHDLGMERVPDAVANPWNIYIERPQEPSRPLTQEQSMPHVFEESGGSLLILGEPGSGKTTTLLDLTRELIQQFENDMSGDVKLPVVFNLSSWSPRADSLEEWLADQIRLQYNIPRDDGLALLAADMILPMLDGLDEVAAEWRDQCVEAINAYSSRRNLTGLVVCCRLKEYEELPVRLALNTAVRLTELNDEQVDEYLGEAGSQLAGLRTLLRQDVDLRFDARSPLWLNLMMRAYYGVEATEPQLEVERSLEDRQRHLMNAYLNRMLWRKKANKETTESSSPSYTEEQTIGWLAWLAHKMNERNLTIFQIEGLQPDWFSTREEIVSHITITRLFRGALTGLASGLIFGFSGRVLLVSILSFTWFFSIDIPQEIFNNIDETRIIQGAIAWFIVGLASGFVGGILESIIMTRKYKIPIVLYSLIYSICFGLVGGVIFSQVDLKIPVKDILDNIPSMLLISIRSPSMLISGILLYGSISGLIFLILTFLLAVPQVVDQRY